MVIAAQVLLVAFPRRRCACRGYTGYPVIALTRSPGQALAPPSGNAPGGAALARATRAILSLHRPVARVRRLRRHPGTSPAALRLPGLHGLSCHCTEPSPGSGACAAIRECPRRRCACRGYTGYPVIALNRRPDQALAPPSGNAPGGAALAGATRAILSLHSQKS